MREGIKAKFSQNHSLKQFLLDTGDKKLVEANPYDQFWSCGIGIKDHKGLLDEKAWPGQNILGIILRETRDSLKM